MVNTFLRIVPLPKSSDDEHRYQNQKHNQYNPAPPRDSQISPVTIDTRTKVGYLYKGVLEGLVANLSHQDCPTVRAARRAGGQQYDAILRRYLESLTPVL
jgi:hypothetical protein